MLKKIIVAIFLFAALPALATDYYVDKGTGNNSNAGTSTDSPWLTISKCASTIVAGDTCNVRSNNQVYFETVAPANDGTADNNRVTYIGHWPGEEDGGKAVIDGSNTLSNGFDMSANFRGDYVTLDGFEIRNFTGQCVDGDVFDHASSTEILNNKIHHCGIHGTVGDSSHGNGIYATYAPDWTIQGNEIYETWYNAINTGDQKNLNTLFTVDNNYIHDGHRVGIGVVATGTLNITNNRVVNWYEGKNGTHADGSQFIGFNHLNILNNYWRDNLQSIEVQPYATPPDNLGTNPGGPVVIRGNIILNTKYNWAGCSNPYGSGIGGFCQGTLIDHGYNPITSVKYTNNIMSQLNAAIGGFSDSDRCCSPTFPVHFQVGNEIISRNFWWRALNSNAASSTNYSYLITSLSSNNNYYNQDADLRNWYLPGFRDLGQYQTLLPAQEVNSLGTPN